MIPCNPSSRLPRGKQNRIQPPTRATSPQRHRRAARHERHRPPRRHVRPPPRPGIRLLHTEQRTRFRRRRNTQRCLVNIIPDGGFAEASLYWVISRPGCPTGTNRADVLRRLAADMSLADSLRLWQAMRLSCLNAWQTPWARCLPSHWPCSSHFQDCP
jgi:hypothetical protein